MLGPAKGWSLVLCVRRVRDILHFLGLLARLFLGVAGLAVVRVLVDWRVLAPVFSALREGSGTPGRARGDERVGRVRYAGGHANRHDADRVQLIRQCWELAVRGSGCSARGALFRFRATGLARGLRQPRPERTVWTGGMGCGRPLPARTLSGSNLATRGARARFEAGGGQRTKSPVVRAMLPCNWRVKSAIWSPFTSA